MNSEALFLAPRQDPDPKRAPALQVSAWVAREVAAVLTRAGVRVSSRPPPSVIRAAMNPAFTPESAIRGVAFFGHGSPVAVFGEDGLPLLDQGNCSVLQGCWFYAYACRAGIEFVAHAAQPGIVAAGYEVALVVEFDPGLIADPLHAAFVEFLAVVPRLLAQGQADDLTIRREVELRAGVVSALLNGMADPPPWVEVAVQQLSGRLVVRHPS